MIRARTPPEPLPVDPAPRNSRRVELKKALDRYLGIPLQVLLHALSVPFALLRSPRASTSRR